MVYCFNIKLYWDRCIAQDKRSLHVVLFKYPVCVNDFISVYTTKGIGDPYSKCSYLAIAQTIAFISTCTTDLKTNTINVYLDCFALAPVRKHLVRSLLSAICEHSNVELTNVGYEVSIRRINVIVRMPPEERAPTVFIAGMICSIAIATANCHVESNTEMNLFR